MLKLFRKFPDELLPFFGHRQFVKEQHCEQNKRTRALARILIFGIYLQTKV